MRPVFQMSADARLLYQKLKTIKIGDTISYAELGAEVNRVVEGGTGVLRTALRRCQVDNQMLFGAIRGVGLKRLTDTEIVSEATATTAAVRRKARRGAARLFLVNDFEGLSERDKSQHMARASILSSVAHLTQERQIDKFIASAKEVRRELPVTETLKMFT